MRALLSSCLGTALCLCSSLSIAAENPRASASRAEPGSEVTVIGRRLRTTAPGLAEARARIAEVPGGAGVVAREDYADGRASTLEDVLGLAPGVFVQPRFGAEESRLSIRGSGLQRTFHLRGIQLLQDGVPLTLADGGGDFQAIEPLALDYTEVLRGANALQYGATSLGGSVNFVAPTGLDAPGLAPRIETGSFGYGRALLAAGGAGERTDAFATLSAYRQEGFRDWSAQHNARLFANAGYAPRDDLDTRFYLALVRSDSQLPGTLTKAQLATAPERANTANLAGRQKRDFDLVRVANRTVLTLEGGTLELGLGHTYKDLWHPIFQVLQQRSGDWVASLRYTGEGTLAGRENRVVFGLVPSWNRVEDDRWANFAGARGARTAEAVTRSRNHVAYLENRWTAAPGWTLVGGLQWTDARRRLDDRFLANGDQSLEAGYARVSPKLGVLHDAGDYAVYANVSDAFEPPSFGELTGGPGVDLLDAQRARTVELGTRGRTGRVEWDASAYSARVRGELLALNSPTGQPLGTRNAARTLHRGLELGATLTLAPGLAWRSAYLLNDFRFDGDPVYRDNRLPGIPPHFYRGELAWQPAGGWYATLSTEWSPRRYAVDMANTWHADAHALVGLRVGRRPERGLAWFVEGRNLADRRYAAATGVIADARGADVAQFLPGEGRAVYAGLEWRTGKAR